MDWNRFAHPLTDIPITESPTDMSLLQTEAGKLSHISSLSLLITIMFALLALFAPLFSSLFSHIMTQTLFLMHSFPRLYGLIAVAFSYLFAAPRRRAPLLLTDFVIRK